MATSIDHPINPYNPTDPSRLAPPDAIPSRGTEGSSSTRRRRFEGKRRGSGRKKGQWKKLLWVRQSYPDNYTDEATFLDHLQRNPRLQPYEFWPLVAASTVIAQHVCAVLVFVTCFAGIVQERVSPVAVVSTGSACTVLGWVFWDYWASHAEDEDLEEDDDDLQQPSTAATTPEEDMAKSSATIKQQRAGLGIDHAEPVQSTSSVMNGNVPVSSPSTVSDTTQNATMDASALSALPDTLSDHNKRRLATVKSAILIYCALLGLSPILKSLTKSTSSDSIWTLSCILLIINVFFFDYSGGVEIKFPAPLSTNAGIMASTVLASRLTSTTHVFSLLLFAIEVFGLFPVFRRYLQHVSWTAHVWLTAGLTLGAGAGIGVTVTGGGWSVAVAGMVLGALGMGLMMATCAMWLIGLQKYKNEIHGPWDPARPVTRRRWD